MIAQTYQAALSDLTSANLPLTTDPARTIDHLMSSRLAAFSTAIAARLSTIGQSGIPEVPRILQITLQHINNVAQLSQTPLSSSALIVAPRAVEAGSSTQGTVSLNGPAPSGGVVVGLSSSNPLVTVPESVKIAAGSTSTSFKIGTSSSLTNATVQITASLDGNVSASLTVNAIEPLLKALSTQSETVYGGASNTLNLELTGIAKANLPIALTSTKPSVFSVPADFVIGNGKSQGTLTSKTAPVSASTNVTINARLAGGTVLTTTFTVEPAKLAALTISPASLVGGTEAEVTIELNGTALPGGDAIKLTSSSEDAQVPTEVIVPGGASTYHFLLKTKAVGKQTAVTITATFGGATISQEITLIN